jgi:hypothetical protein
VVVPVCAVGGGSEALACFPGGLCRRHEGSYTASTVSPRVILSGAKRSASEAERQGSLCCSGRQGRRSWRHWRRGARARLGSQRARIAGDQDSGNSNVANWRTVAEESAELNRRAERVRRPGAPSLGEPDRPGRARSQGSQPQPEVSDASAGRKMGRFVRVLGRIGWMWTGVVLTMFSPRRRLATQVVSVEVV